MGDPQSGVTTALLYKLLWLDDRRARQEKGDANAADWRAKLGYHLWRALPKASGEQGRRNDEVRSFRLELLGLDRLVVRRDTVTGAPAPARLALSIALYRNR